MTSLQQSVSNIVSLKATKAKTKKPSKVVRVVQFNDALTAKIHKSVLSIVKVDNHIQTTLKTVAKSFDSILKYASRDDFIKVQEMFKSDYMRERGVDELASNNAWARIAKHMAVSKPKAQSKDAVRVAKARGAKGVKAKTSKDNRITPLSVKLQEIKTQALKRDIYSVKAMGLLNFAIQGFEVCEAESMADAKPKAKPKAKQVIKA